MRSVNFGVSWDVENNDALAGVVVGAIGINPQNPSQIFAASEANGTVTVFRSPDGATSWSKLGPSFKANQGKLSVVAGQIVVSPKDGDTLFMGDQGYVRTSDADQGAWTKAFAANPKSAPAVHVDLRAWTFVGDTLLLATDGGVYATTDMGKTAKARSNLLQNAQLFKIAADPDPLHPERVFATAQDIGTWRGSDLDLFWSQIGGGDGFMGLFSDPSRANSLFFTMPWGSPGDHDAVLNRTWAADAPHPSTVDVTPQPPGDKTESKEETSSDTYSVAMGVAASSPLEILFGKSWLFRSTNDGDSWTLLASPPGADSTSSFVTAIDATSDPGNPILVAKGHVGSRISAVYFSTDGGQSFQKAKGAPHTFIPSVAIGPQGHAYLATMDLPIGDMSNGTPIYCSTDSGATWAGCSTGLPMGRYGRAVKVDPITPTTVYAGNDIGIYRSTDSGGHWEPFPFPALGTPLPICPVNDIAFGQGSFAEEVILIATHGCGAWELAVSTLPPP
jgi:hypothetical protein